MSLVHATKIPKCIPYSWKYWCEIKFGGLADLEANRQIVLSMCTKMDRRFTKLCYLKEVTLQFACQRSHLFTDEEL